MQNSVAQGAQRRTTVEGRLGLCPHHRRAPCTRRPRRRTVPDVQCSVNGVSSSGDIANGSAQAAEVCSPSYTSDRAWTQGEAIVTAPLQDSHRAMRATTWPPKSSLYLFRTDGMSCSRELVTGTGKFKFSHPSTQQHLLVWRDRPKVIMVIKKLGRELQQQFMQVVHYLGAIEHMHVVVEPAMYDECIAAGLFMDNLYTFTAEERDRLGENVDFVVCLGGDGVILHASSLFKRSIPPVLSFHLGSMGFLTNHHFNDYRAHLRQVIYGCQKLETCSHDADSLPEGNRLGVMITLRMRLHCAVRRRGQTTPEQAYEVLNEVVVDRGSNSYLTNIECLISGRLITRVQADGIMLATPTGSTAYSVAAGGSMVHPNVPAILLTPICPHSLNFRPVILPDYCEVELRVPDNARCSVWVCFDGKQRQELHRGDSVTVKMSENPVPTINKEDLTADWFESLERCFRWSNRMEQKPLDDVQEAERGALRVAADGTHDGAGDGASESWNVPFRSPMDTLRSLREAGRAAVAQEEAHASSNGSSYSGTSSSSGSSSGTHDYGSSMDRSQSESSSGTTNGSSHSSHHSDYASPAGVDTTTSSSDSCNGSNGRQQEAAAQHSMMDVDVQQQVTRQ